MDTALNNFDQTLDGGGGGGDSEHHSDDDDGNNVDYNSGKDYDSQSQVEIRTGSQKQG